MIAETNHVTAPARPEVVALARDLVATELRLDRSVVSERVRLKELPGADSVRLLRVVARIERRYKVQFDDEDIFKVETIGQLADLVVGAVTEG